MYCCDNCVRDRKLCLECRDNPIYKDVPTRSLYKEYISVCPLEAENCIYDPAYTYKYYLEYYKHLYGDMTPEEVVKVKEPCCLVTAFCDQYDDEDK